MTGTYVKLYVAVLLAIVFIVAYQRHSAQVKASEESRAAEQIAKPR